MGNVLAMDRDRRDLLSMLGELHPVDRVAALLDRYAAGALDLGVMLDLFDATQTPLPAELREGADA